MLDLRIGAYARNFDLLADPLPESLYFDFGDQLNRARRLLDTRTRQEIESAIPTLDQQLRDGAKQLFERAIREPNEQGTHISRVKALERLVAESVPTDAEMPFAWSERFAVLVLVYVAEAIHIERTADEAFRERAKISDAEYQAHKAQILAEHASESMDAVATAGRLRNEEDAERRRKSTSGKGGQRSHRRFAPLRSRLQEVFNSTYRAEHSRLGNYGLARVLWNKELTVAERARFEGKDPLRTLANRIGDFSKAPQQRK